MALAAAPALAAPAPAGPTAAQRARALDALKALPDWSGMWQPGRPPAGQGPARPPEAAPAAPPAAGAPPALPSFMRDIPLKPEIAAFQARRMQAVLGQDASGIPLSNSGFCIPSGMPEVMGQVSHEYLFSPGRVTMLMENSEIRRIWTDGRKHPSDDESNPNFSGHSIGHWEGQTLVVDTVQIYPEAEYFFGQHVSEKTHIVERFTRIGDKMRVESVIEDPEQFTKPWVRTQWFDREDREAVPYERCTLADRAQKGDGVLKGIDFDPNKSAGEFK